MSERAKTKVLANKPLSAALWWIRELAAFSLWLFILVKVLIFDVDLVFIRILPAQAEFFLRYKFFSFLGTIALLWLVLGNRRFSRAVAYVIFYPFVIVFWKIPKLLFKNWVLLLVFSPAIHSLVTSIRISFILSVGALLACVVIAQSDSALLLIPAMIFLALYLCRHGAKKIRMAFQPASVFSNIANVVCQLWDYYEKKVFPSQVRVESELDPASDAYSEKTLEHLTNLYLLNSVLQGVVLKLKQSEVSRKLDIYFISSLLYAALLTVVVFAFEFLSLEKLQPGSFGNSSPVGIWQFLGLSFSTLMTAGVSPLVPKSAAAQVFMQCELVVALLLLVILVFVILTILREKFREDAERAITELRRGQDLIEGHISRHYSLSMDDAELKLINKLGTVVNALRRFRGLTVIEIQVSSNLTREQKATTSASKIK